ncbi:hypothetical protein BN7_3308 [Wickerhamomyces ciferrii]|uniref:Topoisomerase I damage affected protein 2 n=1 Tax=Wickerhamomyces ciferrii (strain ATCC 14091 / BCRC 22168 / CBS 111 / JCM 3599 / NBRC 0793 / NRRL Y-1031 F-60-10) TaxID=1206466 RepID=K0KR42_WICCF|nr:uncharacterized protein BN7_3308 [Wickerhamomyces ciferrii]CCH43754.1 hypothetical protein BN7_3308 [Wickerhamomyces ciferrii]
MPAVKEELETIVTKVITGFKDSSIDEVSSSITNLILKELQPKTVDYKIIINASIVNKKIKDEVKQTAGYLYTDSTDGYYTLKFDLKEDYDLILNVIYVK